MDLNFSAFQEPRGVMRILHFVFSICAFATIVDYTGYITLLCDKNSQIEFSYPFSISVAKSVNNNNSCTVSISNDFSSDAKFFVATGVLAMLYSIAIILVYAKMDEAYKANKKYPLYDFLITVFLAVLWLSSSAAWANGLSGLKSATSNPSFSTPDCCKIVTSSYSTLNISVIFGFLNFFLWAADLWFLYKETEWFQGAQVQSSGGV
ncbi:synaptophysin-like protein 2 [Sitophilus oryzae]|uniref:Synaptophysin-like protein 2 n=1 Tax=Sitophilus oryzae TaxID=7048 RepID=A0A6J2XAQ9_SITOR|nr:synaptophysin-like protein 2 [Sitophilus oryzae]